MPYRPGDYYAICDQCGFRYFASEMKMQWNNLFTCPQCYEEKHPQYVDPKPLHEKQRVTIHRPEQSDVFLAPGDVTPDDL